MIAVAVLSVAGALITVAAGQAIVADSQVHLDTINQELSSALAQNENLQLSRAKLAAPARILQLAEERYGMVVPRSVTYLAPLDPGRSVIESARKSRR
jgi:cell division protein FtsL